MMPESSAHPNWPTANAHTLAMGRSLMADFAGATCTPVTLAVVALPILTTSESTLTQCQNPVYTPHTMRSTIVGMTSLTEQLPYVYAFLMRWGPDYWCTPRAYWTMRYAIVLARSSMNMRLYYLDSAMIPSSAGCARPHMAARSFSRLGIGSVWPVRPPVCGNRWGDRPVRGRGFDSAWL